MYASLLSLPQNVSNAYKEIMERIERRGSMVKDFALRILLWVFNAKRPLQMKELCELLSIKPGDKDICEKWCPKEERVVDVCESLIIYDKSSGTVRFTHHTVNEFLHECGNNYLPHVSYLADICITYLTFDVFENGFCDYTAFRERREKYKASCYIGDSWGFHIRQSEPWAVDQKAILALLASDNRRNSMLQMQDMLENTLEKVQAIFPSSKVGRFFMLSPRRDWQRLAD